MKDNNCITPLKSIASYTKKKSYNPIADVIFPDDVSALLSIGVHSTARKIKETQSSQEEPKLL